MHADLRFQTDSDGTAEILGLVDEREYSTGDCWPLDYKRSQEKIESNAAVAIATEKRHQKSKSDKHHHMNILKNCTISCDSMVIIIIP